MKFRIAPLLCLLSGIAFINAPACGMDDEDAKKPLIIQKARFKYPTTDAEIPIDHIAITYRVLRDKGNDAPDKELVAYLLGKTWEQLTATEQKEIVTDVVRKAKEIRFEELMRQSSVLEKYRAVRAINSASDLVLIEYLYGPGWVKLDDEGQKEIVTRVTRKAKIIHFEELMRQSSVLEKYRAVRAINSAPDLELVRFLYGIEEWALLSPEDQDSFVHLVVRKSQMMDEVTLVDLMKSEKFSETFRILKTREVLFSDEECVKLALEQNAYTGWSRLTSDLKLRTISIVTRKFRQELKGFILLNSIPKSLRNSLPLIVSEIIKDGDKRSVSDILQQVLGIYDHGEVWDKLGEAGQQYLVDRVLRKSTPSDFEDLKQVKLNEQRFILKERDVPRDGDCGYVAMGFEGREVGVQFLLPHIHRPEVRELIAPEIYDMLSQLPPDNPVVTHEQAQRLFAAQDINDRSYQKICSQLNDIFELSAGKRVDGDYLYEIYQSSTEPQIIILHQQLTKVRQKMAEFELDKLNYCKQEDTVKSFIETFMQIDAGTYYDRHNDTNWLNFSTILSTDGKYRTYAIHALAFLQNKNLIIVDDKGGIKHAYKYDDGLEFLPENTTFLLHTDDFGEGCTHFNKLIPLNTFVEPLL